MINVRSIEILVYYLKAYIHTQYIHKYSRTYIQTFIHTYTLLLFKINTLESNKKKYEHAMHDVYYPPIYVGAMAGSPVAGTVVGSSVGTRVGTVVGSAVWSLAL